jgi:serine/threonine-protein kinase
MLTKLGKYEIVAELGSGSMGVVYRGLDPRLGRPVALKTMSPSVAGNPELLKRFYREAQSAGSLRHPNIVTIYDIDEADGIPFIAMEFLEGEDLDKIISARKDVTVVKKLDIIIQSCKGLHYAHQHGIVHRDVKPGNIVLLNDGMVKIVDFGIARIGVASMTRTGMVLGTVMYMSPEQVKGVTVDARSDIFSLGIILYELLTFQSPFPGRDVPAILFKILNEPPQAITELLPNCPPQLEKIVLRALEKNREERYQSAEDMAFELQRVADSLKRSMVEIYLKQGQQSFQDRNLTVAKESLMRVLEIDSSHEVAKSLLEQVQSLIYERQRTQKVDDFIRQAKEALGAELYDDAVHILDEILRLDPQQPEARQYKQMAVERREVAHKLARLLERAEKLTADADFPAAKTELEAILAIDRNHPTARKMMDWVVKELTEQERLRQVRQFAQTARTHLAEKNFGKTLELLEKARELDPINIEVDSLLRLARSGLEKQERRGVLDQRLAEIQEALNQDQFERALGLAEESLRLFPDDASLLKLHTMAQRQQDAHQKRRSVDEQLAAARGFLDQGDFSSAETVLERAIQSAPDDPRLPAFLKTVQETRERTTLETRRRDALQEAHELIRKKKFTAAVETLERALAQAGSSPDLAELLQFAREQAAETETEERVRQVLSQAQSYLLEENFDEAVGLLERNLAGLKAASMEKLLATARSQRESFARRQQETMGRARQLLDKGEAAQAVALLDAAPKGFFKIEAFQQLYALCREGLDRATFVRTAIEQIEKNLAEGDIVQAERVLHHALKSYPREGKLQRYQKRLEEQGVELRQRHWNKVVDEAKVAMGRMQFRQAIELLSPLVEEARDNPQLVADVRALLEQAREREQEVRRRTPELPPPLPRRAPALEPTIPLAERKGLPTVVWAGVGMVVLLVAAGIAWQLFFRPVEPGFVQLTAIPWAEIQSVKNAKNGERIDVSGQTPLQLALAPGSYVIELRSSSQEVAEVPFEVKAGQIVQKTYAFPTVKVEALIDDLLFNY